MIIKLLKELRDSSLSMAIVMSLLLLMDLTPTWGYVLNFVAFWFALGLVAVILEVRAEIKAEQ
jgi:hypothetical protein